MDVSPSNPALGKLPDFAPGFLLHARTRLNLHFSWNTSRVHPGEQDPMSSGSVSFRLEKSLKKPCTRWAPTIVINGVVTLVNGLIYTWVTGGISPLQVFGPTSTCFSGATGPPAVMPSSSPLASRMTTF